MCWKMIGQKFMKRDVLSSSQTRVVLFSVRGRQRNCPHESTFIPNVGDTEKECRCGGSSVAHRPSAPLVHKLLLTNESFWHNVSPPVRMSKLMGTQGNRFLELCFAWSCAKSRWNNSANFCKKSIGQLPAPQHDIIGDLI